MEDSSTSPTLSGSDVARVRRQRGWSQQQLSLASGVTRPYISEYEAGLRPNLPAHMLQAISRALLEPPAGMTTPELVRDKNGRLRLKLSGPGGELWPEDASVQWTEADGTSYSIFVGRVE